MECHARYLVVKATMLILQLLKFPLKVKLVALSMVTPCQHAGRERPYIENAKSGTLGQKMTEGT